jgi:hypothetical protein
MGCDIHMFLEYADFTQSNGDVYWSCFGGSYNPGRDYYMFGLLAGVRSDRTLFEPKGLPDGRLSYQAESYMTLWISDEHAGGENACTLADARKWEAQGETITNDKDGKPYRVSNPDLHSYSWLSLEDYRYVLVYYKLGDKAAEIDVDPEDHQAVIQAVAALRGGGERYDVGYGAILAAMEHIEQRGKQTRLVFCFDN